MSLKASSLLAYIFSEQTVTGGQCFECGLHSAVFTVDRKHLADCPGCIATRIRSLTNIPALDSGWVARLLAKADKEVLHQREKEAGESLISFDDYYRCARCDKVVHASEARYHFEPKATASPPYCRACGDDLNGPPPDPSEPERILYEVKRDPETGWLFRDPEDSGL